MRGNSYPGLAIAVGLLAACAPVTPNVQVGTTVSPLEGGVTVSASMIQQTGAVLLIVSRPGEDPVGCSGMLVSPLWVLTASHCGSPADKAIAVAGNRPGLPAQPNFTTPDASRVYRVFTPSRTPPLSPGADARLLMLSNPLFPLNARGERRYGYNMSLASGRIADDTPVEVYAFGTTLDVNLSENPEAFAAARQSAGVLRYGKFEVDGFDGPLMEIDGPVHARAADSGAAILVPQHSHAGAWDDYRIAGVITQATADVGFLSDDYAQRPHSGAFRDWFESTRNLYRNVILSPDQVMNVLRF